MRRERGAGGLAEAVHDVQHAGRQTRPPESTSASSVEDIGDHSAGFRTTVLPAASAGARRHVDSISGAFQGMISPATPDRLVHRVVDELVADLERAAVQLGDDAGVVVEVHRRARRETARLRDRHTGVEHLDADELVGVLADQCRDPAQHRRALGGRHAGPGTLVERPARSRDGIVDVGRLPIGDHRDHLVRGRAPGLERPASAACAEGAIDEVALQRERLALGERHRGGSLIVSHLEGLPGRRHSLAARIISSF